MLKSYSSSQKEYSSSQKNYSSREKSHSRDNSTIISHLFPRFIHQLTLNLPKFIHFGFILQAVNQLQIGALILEHIYLIYNKSDSDDILQNLLTNLYSWINLKDQYNINDVSSVDNSIIFTIIIVYLFFILMFNIASATFTSVEKSIDGIFGKIWGCICIVHSSVFCTPIQGYLLKIIISYFDGEFKLYTENNKLLSLVIITMLLIFNRPITSF